MAIDDCRGVSARLEQALIAAGEQVVRVAPQRMGASRRGERRPGKSDEIDALAIARAVVKDGVEAFPVAHLDAQAMEPVASVSRPATTSAPPDTRWPARGRVMTTVGGRSTCAGR